MKKNKYLEGVKEKTISVFRYVLGVGVAIVVGVFLFNMLLVRDGKEPMIGFLLPDWLRKMVQPKTQTKAMAVQVATREMKSGGEYVPFEEILTAREEYVMTSPANSDAMRQAMGVAV